MHSHTRVTAGAGLLIVDKPAQMTSHDVVARVRQVMHTRKVGHAGTLDPIATGVLVLGIGRATKLLGHLALDRKSYLATIALGASTSTDDIEGEVITQADPAEVAAVTEDALDAAIEPLVGSIQQVPSAVSAVKVDGVRAYERARAGEQVDLPARPVTVHRFDRLTLRRDTGDPGRIEADVVIDCSSGTYVRALARDLGSTLGVGGHVTVLRRTTVGPFALAAARTLDQIAQQPALSLDLDQSVVTAFETRQVDEEAARAVRYGQRISSGGFDETYGIVDPDGHALALAADEGKRTRLLVVLDPA